MVIVDKRFPREKAVSTKGAINQNLLLFIRKRRLVRLFRLRFNEDTGARVTAVGSDGPTELVLLASCVVLCKRRSEMTRLGLYCTHYAEVLLIVR